ncbi:diguanylate cyclase [Candidatus Sumerlaeota bacterium]|nr:diguanylate cyclase [Candidatus Sumerlaeota bacterium]
MGLHTTLPAVGFGGGRANGDRGHDIVDEQRGTSTLSDHDGHREREALYRRAIAEAHAVAYQRDYSRPGFTFIDPGIERMTGYRPEELNSETWRGLIRESVMLGESAGLTMEEALRRARAGEIREWHGDYRIRTRSGDERWLSDTAVQILDGASKPIGSLGILQDITERKRSEEERQERLRQTSLQRSTIVRLATHPAVISGEIEDATRAITEMAAETLRVERVGIWQLSEDHQHLHCVDLFERSHQMHTAGQTLSAGDHPQYFESIEVERALDVHDTLTDPRTLTFRESYFIPLGITSMLDAGIRLGGAVTGIVCHEHVGERRTWTADEIGFAGAIADQMAQALLNRDRLRASQALRVREALYRRAIAEADAVAYQREYGSPGFVFIDAGIERMTGYRPEELTSETWRGLIQESVMRGECTGLSMAEAIKHIRAREMKEWRADFRIRTRDGEERWLSDSSVQVLDERGKPVGSLGILQDITERKRTEERLALMATTDELTGLHNRRLLMERLTQETLRSQRYGTPLSLLMLDLDHFKSVNDTHGHLVGDQVLITMARLITATIRVTDIAGRYGGEEMCIALTETGASGAECIAERLRQRIADFEFTDSSGCVFHVTASIGVATHDGADDVDTMLALADAALYRAKEGGRNRVICSR